MGALEEFAKMTPEMQARFARCSLCGLPLQTGQRWRRFATSETYAHEACLDELRDRVYEPNLILKTLEEEGP